MFKNWKLEDKVYLLCVLTIILSFILCRWWFGSRSEMIVPNIPGMTFIPIADVMIFIAGIIFPIAQAFFKIKENWQPKSLRYKTLAKCLCVMATLGCLAYYMISVY